MKSKIQTIFPGVLLSLFFLFTSTNHAQQNKPELKLYGDVRNRIENDWDSRKKDGTLRDDRTRMRFRLRFGFTYSYNQNIEFGGRIRSGNPLATQSPHVDYGNELIPKTLNIDKAFIKVKWNKGSFWAGKNSYPFWKQNEFFWDDDATPEGIAVNQKLSLGAKNNLKLIGGFFLLDNSASNSLDEKAKFMGIQSVLNLKLDNTNINSAIGYLNFTEDDKHDDIRMMDLDYELFQGSSNVSFPVTNTKSIKVGIDFSYNLKTYPNSLANYDQKTGYVGSVKIGDLNNSGSWLIGYYYAHIEKYAVVPGYAQDDWVRWGTSTVTRSSNLQGHEFRVAYALGKKHNIVARMYLVDGITIEEGGTTLENGKRFRLDWNIGF